MTTTLNVNDHRIDFDDHRMALVAVAAFLNAGYTVGVELDAVDCDPIAALRAKIGEPTRANAKARIVASQARAAAFNEVRDIDHAENVRKDVERITKARMKAYREDKLAREMAYAETDAAHIKQSAYDSRYMLAQAARIVECSSCGAKVDYPCVTPQGKAYGAFVHTARVQAQQTANGS